MGRILIGALLVVGLASEVAEVSAQVNNDAAAEALFLEGRALMERKDYAAAAAKFGASDKASPSVGARLNQGDCYAALDRTASAWTAYKAAANLAQQKQDSARARLANTKATELSARLTYLIVAVPEPVPGLVVTAAGNPVSAALFGQRVPVDPGSLSIAASAPGFERFSTDVKTAGPGQAVTATIPKLASQAGDARPDPDVKPDVKPDGEPGIKPDVTPDPGGDTVEVEDPGRTRRLLGLSVGAAGLVGVGVGLAFGAAARSNWNSAFDDGLCDEDTNVCDDEGQDKTDAARTQATISTIAVVAGVALAGAGVVLYLTAPSAGDGGASARVSPMVGDRELGVALSGSF